MAKIFFRRLGWKILMGAIFGIFILGTIYGLKSLKYPDKTAHMDDYKYLASLPAEFVHQSKIAELKSDIPWELMAAYYQVNIEEKLISNYPQLTNIERLVDTFKQSDDLSNLKKVLSLKIKDKALIEKVVKRYELLQRHSYLFTTAYGFPLTYQELFYKDTWGEDRDEGQRPHQGTDLFAPEGTPIYAISDGIVERIGWNRLGGKRIGVRGIDGLYYYYAHLQDFVPNLKVKEQIKRGMLIGYVGKTGNAINTPPHLHLGIEISENQWINPYNLLNYWQLYGENP